MQKLYSEDFEKALLGCMLLDNSIIDDVSVTIKPHSLCINKYSVIYEKICELYTENDSCDLVMLSTALPKYVSDIAELTNVVSSAANYEYYVGEINKLYTSRKYMDFIKSKASEIDGKNIEDILSDTDDFVSDCLSNSKRVEPVNSKQMCVNIIEDIQENAKRKGSLEGFDTGYPELNAKTGGLMPGNLVIIGARPSIGKTAYSDCLATNMALAGSKVVQFSYEMTKKEIQRRRIARLSNVQIKKIKSGFLSAAEIKRVNDACEKLFYTDMLLYDTASLGFGFNELVSKIRVHAKQGYKIFFIDHLGLLEYEGMQGAKEWEKISQMTKRLKKLASTLDIVIVGLCQLTRDSEGKEPLLNSLRGSGSIEQDANVIMFLHRERQQSNEVSIPTKLLVTKNRDGDCGEIELEFIPATTSFREAEADKNDFIVHKKTENKVDNLPKNQQTMFEE